MEDFTKALMGLFAALISAATPFLIQWLRARTLRLTQELLGEGSSRVAGEIAGVIAGDPNLSAATDALVQAGVTALQERFPKTAAKVPLETLAGMVRGELGKLGVALAQSGSEPLQAPEEAVRIPTPPIPVRFFGQD